jgi:hypothetical protein
MAEPLSDLTGVVQKRTVEINGIRFNLGEFDMRTRALWIDIVEEYDLQKMQIHIQSVVIPKISNIATDIENDPRLRSIGKRIDKLGEKHDALIELYASDEEPEGIDGQLNDLVVRIETAREELKVMAERIQNEVMQDAQEAESAIGEFMAKQDKARIDFVYRLASAMGKVTVSLDEFFESCSGDDYQAAEKFVQEGNESWASLYNNRLQRKPNKKILN